MEILLWPWRTGRNSMPMGTRREKEACKLYGTSQLEETQTHGCAAVPNVDQMIRSKLLQQSMRDFARTKEVTTLDEVVQEVIN